MVNMIVYEGVLLGFDWLMELLVVTDWNALHACPLVAAKKT